MPVILPGGRIAARQSKRGPLWTPQRGSAGGAPHLWLDARQEGLAQGVGVAQFTDRAVVPHNLVQATGANQPLAQLYPNGINGRPSFLFDAANDYLSTALNAFTPLTNCTMAFVARTGADVASPHNVMTSVNSAVNAQVGFGITGSAWSLSGSAFLGGPAAAINTNYRMVFTYNGASSAIWMNGTLSTTGNAGATDIASWRMGADNSVGGPWNGLIGEVIAWPFIITPEEIGQLDLYFARGWGF